MSENQPHLEHAGEHHRVHHERSPEHERAPKEAIDKGKHAEHEHQKSIETIKHSIEQEAMSGKEYAAAERQHAPKETNHYNLNKSVKKAAYQKTMKQTRQQLSAPERGLSRVIHQPAVDALSNVVGKTVARPSGILIGGIGALVGSLFLYFMGRRYGFAYNFLLYTLLFAVCYILGVTGEYILRLAARIRHK